MHEQFPRDLQLQYQPIHWTSWPSSAAPWTMTPLHNSNLCYSSWFHQVLLQKLLQFCTLQPSGYSFIFWTDPRKHSMRASASHRQHVTPGRKPQTGQLSTSQNNFPDWTATSTATLITPVVLSLLLLSPLQLLHPLHHLHWYMWASLTFVVSWKW